MTRETDTAADTDADTDADLDADSTPDTYDSRDSRDNYDTRDIRVPPDDSASECPYCQRPLETEELLILHEGLDHWEQLTDEEREAFRETYAEETDDLRTFRLKMLALLILLYFAFLFVYSFYTDDPLSATLLVVASIPSRRAR